MFDTTTTWDDLNSVDLGFFSMSERLLRLNYLHLMNKAAESGDQKGYYYYLMKADKAIQARSEGQNSKTSAAPHSALTGLNT